MPIYKPALCDVVAAAARHARGGVRAEDARRAEPAAKGEGKRRELQGKRRVMAMAPLRDHRMGDVSG